MFGALRGQHGAFPPPPCGKATKGHMIKVESVLDRPLAPCRGSRAALANLATAKPLTASTDQPENGGCARAHPPKQNVTEKGRSPCKKVRQSLQASINTPFEARGLLSGTIIRGTPNTPKLGW
jgi:hypothetical protein